MFFQYLQQIQKGEGFLMNRGVMDQLLHTHNNTLPRFALFTMIPWQSWHTSFTLVKTQGTMKPEDGRDAYAS